jgi:hypothetical protein
MSQYSMFTCLALLVCTRAVSVRRARMLSGSIVTWKVLTGRFGFLSNIQRLTRVNCSNQRNSP